MELKAQIDLMVAKRKQKGDILRARRESVAAAKQQLKDSSAKLISCVKAIQDEELRKQYLSIVNGLNTKNVQRAIDYLLRRLDDGIKRFDRDYISIATVGKERQGKSRFLQSVGDLDNSIIPAYDATSCTGATSVIWNDPEMPRGHVRTVISFRQSSELLEIVRTYIRELDPQYLTEQDLIFDDIGYINLAAFSAGIETGNAKQATALHHLSDIVEHFDDIRDLFGASSIELTDPELIKTFVAQNNGKNATDPDVEYYYRYLAVARADIYCPFFVDVGKIRLVDTVGIGDTKYGIEDAMLNTVDKECDAAIVVTRPISGVQVGDLELYESLREKFKLRDTSLWLFYLVNHFSGQNDNTVEAFSREVQNSKWAIANCSVVDASDQKAVRDDFVMPMLQILVMNMDAIDQAYMNALQEQENAVQKAIEEFTKQFPPMQHLSAESLLGMEAYKKGKECFNRMTSDLSKAVSSWSEKREQSSSVLWNRVQAILNDLDSIIPSPEQIQNISDANGDLLGERVWEMVLHNVRNEITDRFIQIDDVLEKATLEFKNSLVRSLYYELRNLSPDDAAELADEESVDMVQWLKSMMDGILSDNSQYAQICKAFNFLYRFEFNTRAQMIREVRRQMYIINPICQEYAKPSINFQKKSCGDAVHFYLTSRMSVIEDELRYHLSKLYKTPNQAFYAAAEEFYDRLTFASNLSGSSLTSMSDVWGMFFQEYSSKLWKEDTERYTSVNALIDEYNQLLAYLQEFADQASTNA